MYKHSLIMHNSVKFKVLYILHSAWQQYGRLTYLSTLDVARYIGVKESSLRVTLSNLAYVWPKKHGWQELIERRFDGLRYEYRISWYGIQRLQRFYIYQPEAVRQWVHEIKLWRRFTGHLSDVSDITQLRKQLKKITVAAG